MESNIISQTKQGIAGRVRVLATTTPAAPALLPLNIQNPFLVDFRIVFFNVVAGNIYNYGFRLTDHGKVIYPATGSNEIDFNAGGLGFIGSGGYAGVGNPYGEFYSGELNHQLNGSPYKLALEVFNLSAAEITVNFFARIAPKIKLPDVPISTEVKETKLNKEGIDA